MMTLALGIFKSAVVRGAGFSKKKWIIREV
jgi:hypothetical protein